MPADRVGARGHVGVFTFPAYAHIAPAVPLLAELVRRDHRVTCLVAQRFTDMLREVGVEVVVYESAFPWFDGLEESSTLRTMLDFFAESLAPMPAALARFAGDRPDLIAHDLAASESARTLARAWELPVVQLCPTIASSPGFSMSARQNEVAADDPPAPPISPTDSAIGEFLDRRQAILGPAGLAEVDIDGFGVEHGPNIVFMPKAFQIAPETFDERFTFIGPCLTEQSGPGGWAPPEDGRPVLLLSLGSSSSPNQGQFLRACVEALADSRWHVVVTLGHRVQLAELGPLAPNIEAHRWLRHPEVLRHSAAFITHGGLGSLMESLYYGVPVLLAPYHVDQRVIAARAAELNLGRVLPRDQVTPATLRAAVDTVAADPGIRAAVRRMRDEVRRAGGAGRGAEVIESLLPPPTLPSTPRPQRK